MKASKAQVELCNRIGVPVRWAALIQYFKTGKRTRPTVGWAVDSNLRFEDLPKDAVDAWDAVAKEAIKQLC